MWLRTVIFSSLIYLSIIIPATHGFAQEKTVRFVDAQGDTLTEVEFILHDENIYLPVDTLKSVFDSKLTSQYHRPRKLLTIKTKGKKIELHIGQTDVNIDSGSQKYTLPLPPREIHKQPMLPMAFFTQILPQLDEIELRYNANLQRVRIIPKKVWDVTPTGTIREWTIILDPGHGGEDTGCQTQNGLHEKDIVLSVAKEIQALGKQTGISILLTRNEDVSTKRIRRVQISNQNQGQLFLSLHCNASYSPTHKGIRLYLNNPNGLMKIRPKPIPVFGSKHLEIITQADFIRQSRDFASILQNELSFLVEDTIEVLEFPIITLSDVYMPAVLLELGYLSNTDDASRLANSDHISELSQSIFQALQLYSASVNKPIETNGITTEESSDAD